MEEEGLSRSRASRESRTFYNALELRSPPGDPPSRSSPTTEPEAKRRKIRKGTRSCWECKRRKVRCNFTSDADAVCIGCLRRATKCVSQEYPEEVSAPADKGRQMGDRIVRVEALVEQLVKTVATGSSTNQPLRATPDPGIPTPSSSDTAELPQILSLCEPTPESAPLDREELPVSPYSATDHRPVADPPAPVYIAPARSSRYEAISRALYAAYPSLEDLKTLRESGASTVVTFNQMVTVPLYVLERDGPQTSDVWFNPPDQNLHPVVLAKHMMMLATTLQSLYPHVDVAVPSLSESPYDIARRLRDVASSLVIANDEFVGTIEDLEVIMYEGMYQANFGNLRRSWLVFRKAMTVAQLMGIHKAHFQKPLKVIDPTRRVYPEYLWYRIVFADRTTCMMLGLPQGSSDTSMTSPAAMALESAEGRLERVQCVLSARLLARNDSVPNGDDYQGAKELDLELQKAAKMVPGKWWLIPSLTKVASDPVALFWAALRLARQLYHFHLLIQLHLPYMLRASHPCLSEEGRNYEYSKATCVTAAREVLNRFVDYRSFNRVAFCCRTIDFYGLMAALTLLLAHLHSHRVPAGDNFLAHQRVSDRAMMEEVLENMECVSRLNDDALSEKSANLLRRLLAIEEAAAEGGGYGGGGANGREENADGNTLRISVPYFGNVKIDPKGGISIELHGPHQPPEASQRYENSVTGESHTAATVGLHPRAWGCGLPVLPGEIAAGAFGGGLIPRETAASPAQQCAPPSQLPTVANDSLEQELNYPALAAPADDWAFQGVDLAFFDTLMKGATSSDAVDENGGHWESWLT